MKIIIMLCCLGLISVSLGCGRVSKPRSPAGAYYPHVYFVKEKNMQPPQKIEKEEAEAEEAEYADSIYD